MDEGNKMAVEYLKAPYSRVLIPDAETGTYAAKITEFPGCVAQGDTPEEAYQNLEAAAESWIEELVGMGQQVPEPNVFNQYSGRVALRLPKSLHRNAAQLAEREGTSLNQFLVSAIAERVGAGTLYEELGQGLGERVARVVAESVGVVFSSAIGAPARTWPDWHTRWGATDTPLQVNEFLIPGAAPSFAMTGQPVVLYRAEERSEANG
jgi:antitoxin HicB